MKIQRLCDQIIFIALIALIIILPLFFDIRVYSVFDLTKVIAMFLPALLIMGVWLIKMIFKDEFEFPLTPLTPPILAFVSIAIIATIFSINPVMSLIGAYKRFEGLIETCTYIFLFFAFVTYVNNVRKLNIVINAIVGTAVSTSVYGFMQYFGKDPFMWSSSTPERIFSTFGNPVFYSAFLLTTLPLSLALYLGYERTENDGGSAVGYHQTANNRVKKDIIYGICTLLIYIIFWHTRTRADFLGLMVLLPVFVVFLGKARIKLYKWKLLIMFVLFVIIGTFYGVRPKSSVFSYFAAEISFKEEEKKTEENEISSAKSSDANDRSFLVSKLSGSSLNRYYQYKTALKIFNEYPILGLGPDTLGIVYQEYLGRVFKRRKDDNFNWPRHDKIHNDVLDNVVAKGSLGLITYIWLVLAYFCMVWKFLKLEGASGNTQSSNRKTQSPNKADQLTIFKRDSLIDKRILVVSFGSAILGYLVQNEFSFGNTVIVTFFWTVLALTVVVIRKGGLSSCPSHLVQYDNRELSVSGGGMVDSQLSKRKVLLSVLVVSIVAFLIINVLQWYRADMYMESGRKYIKKGNMDEGLKSYEYAISYNPCEISYRDMLVNSLFFAASTNKERALLESIINISNDTLAIAPNHFAGHYALANAYYLLAQNHGDKTIDLAIENYKKTIEIDPFHPQLYHYLAMSYIRKEMYDDAIEYLNQAIIAGTNDMLYIDKLARLYLFLDNMDDLKELLDEISPVLNPTDSFCNVKGFFFLKTGKGEEAYNEFAKALEINPDNAEALENIINIGTQLKKTESTIRHLEHAIELQPENVSFRMRLANLYAQEGFLDESIFQFNQIIQLDPRKQVVCLDKLGKIFMARQEFDNSLECFRKAVEISPLDAEMHNNLGTIYAQKEMHDDAVAEIKKALEISPDNPTFMVNLAKLYYVQNMHEKAKDILNRVISLDEGNEEAAELIEQMKQEKTP